MSQPAMTKALARIEERCGMALFARNRNGIELTKAGRLVFDEVQLRVRGLDRLNDAIETIRSGRRGHIRLASIPVLAEGSIGTLIGEYLRHNREVRVELTLERVDVIPQRLRAGEIDMGFLFGPHPGMDDLTTVRLGERRLVVAAPADSPWSERKSWRFDEIGDIPIVHLLGPHPIRSTVDYNFTRMGARPHVVCEAASQFAVANIVATGAGIGFLDSETARHLSQSWRVSIAPVEPTTLWPVLAIHDAMLDEVPAAKQLLQFIKTRMTGAPARAA